MYHRKLYVCRLVDLSCFTCKLLLYMQVTFFVQAELDSIQHSIEPSLEDLVKKMRGRTKKRVRTSE